MLFNRFYALEYKYFGAANTLDALLLSKVMKHFWAKMLLIEVEKSMVQYFHTSCLRSEIIKRFIDFVRLTESFGNDF